MSQPVRRDAYRTVGRLTRATIGCALAGDCSPMELRVLFVVITLTTSWSKIEDRTSAKQIAAQVYARPAEEVSGGQRKRVGEALRRLAEKKIITYRPGVGRYAYATIGLHPNAESLNAPRERVIECESSAQRTSSATSMHPTDDSNAPHQRGTTEEYPEDVSPRPQVRRDRLTERLTTHFGSRFSVGECADAIERLRREGIGDLVIDAAIGKAIEAGATSLGYVTKVARDWFKSPTVRT